MLQYNFSNTIKFTWSILPLKYKKNTILVLLLTLLGTLLEAVGIGLVIPAVSLMLDDNFINKYPLLINFFNGLNPSQSTLVLYGILLLFVSYFIKAIYLVFLAWFQSMYIYNIKRYLSSKLFEKYISLPYEFHLQTNSSFLIRNITSEIQELINRALIPLVMLITEIAVIIVLALLLLIIEPLGASILFFVIIFAMFIFHLFSYKYLKEWGNIRQREEGYRIKSAQEGLSAIKDVKLLGRESNFINCYDYHNLNVSTVESKQNTLSQVPRLWLETVGVFGLLILVFINNKPTEIVPIIGLFAAAAFRLLPSANRVLNSFQSLKYSSAVISLIIKELRNENINIENNKIKFQFNKCIELKNISFKYPESSISTLNNINFIINKGDSIGIIGSSGSGKSTLVDLLLGLITPSSGSISIDGVNINNFMREWQNTVGYVQQSIYLIDDTLRKNIAFGLNDNEINDELIKNAIKEAQLESFIYSLPDGINTLVGERGVRLSGGQRQRIGIARALYNNPPMLVLDEATSSLDKKTEADVMKSINALKRNRTIIIVAHRLSTIEHCDKIIKINNGIIY